MFEKIEDKFLALDPIQLQGENDTSAEILEKSKICKGKILLIKKDASWKCDETSVGSIAEHEVNLSIYFVAFACFSIFIFGVYNRKNAHYERLLHIEFLDEVDEI